jgi:hypothetical protein
MEASFFLVMAFMVLSTALAAIPTPVPAAIPDES